MKTTIFYFQGLHGKVIEKGAAGEQAKRLYQKISKEGRDCNTKLVEQKRIPSHFKIVFENRLFIHRGIMKKKKEVTGSNENYCSTFLFQFIILFFFFVVFWFIIVAAVLVALGCRKGRNA